MRLFNKKTNKSVIKPVVEFVDISNNTNMKKERKGIFFEKYKKKKEHKNSDDLFDYVSKEEDAISPTFIREIDKRDTVFNNKVDNYYVEVGTTVGFGRFYRSFFATMKGDNTNFGIFDDLYTGNFGEADSDVAIHISPTDDAKTRYALTRKIASLEADLINEQDTVKIKQLRDQLTELHHQEERLRKNYEKLYRTSIQVMVSSDILEKIKKFTNRMLKRMANQNIFFAAADTKQLPALLSMTPLDNTVNDFKHTFRNGETSNIADMFPFGFGTISHTTGILLGEDVYGNPVFYNDRHPSLQNYNSVTFGMSGSGKSMKTKIMQARKALERTMTTIIDYEFENRDWILNLGFPYIEFTPYNEEHTLNMFPVPRIVISRSGQTYCDIDDAVNAVSAVVFKLLKITTEKPLSGNKKILLKEAIQKCYQHLEISYDPDSIYEDSDMLKDGFVKIDRKIKKMPQAYNLYEDLANYPELSEERIIVKSFTKAGNIRSQSVFDCQTTVNFKDNLIVGMSVAGLDEIMRPLGLLIGTTNCWSTYERIPKSIKKDIIVDEAQNTMQEEEEATLLENRFRIARRRNIGMHAITQGFEVFLRKPQGMGILKNASTKFLFRQDPMDIDAVEGKFNLPEGAKMRLLNFSAGECILIAGNEMAHMRTKPTPYEYELFNTNPNEVEEDIV